MASFCFLISSTVGNCGNVGGFDPVGGEFGRDSGDLCNTGLFFCLDASTSSISIGGCETSPEAMTPSVGNCCGWAVFGVCVGDVGLYAWDGCCANCSWRFSYFACSSDTSCPNCCAAWTAPCK